MTRFMNKRLHAYLDYPVAFGLMVMPFLLGLGAVNPLVLWLSAAAGVAVLILTLFTDHPLGVIKILPYKLHLVLDILVGGAFVVAPSALELSGLEALYFWGLGGAVLIVVSFDDTLEGVPVK